MQKLIDFLAQLDSRNYQVWVNPENLDEFCVSDVNPKDYISIGKIEDLSFAAESSSLEDFLYNREDIFYKSTKRVAELHYNGRKTLVNIKGIIDSYNINLNPVFQAWLDSQVNAVSKLNARNFLKGLCKRLNL
jgi:hypothetical protein